jgi:hypothetical protein
MTFPRSLLLLCLVPACATEPAASPPAPLGGIEPMKPCAAVAYYVDRPDEKVRFTYEYDDDGNDHSIDAVDANGRPIDHLEYRDGLLETSVHWFDTPTGRTVVERWYTNERGLAVEALVEAWDGVTRTHGWENWTWDWTVSPPDLREYAERPEDGRDVIHTFTALVEDNGFRESVTVLDPSAGYRVVDHLGPHEFVGDQRGWTVERTSEDGAAPVVTAERVFRDDELILSDRRYDATGALTSMTTWQRDEDGVLRARLVEAPGRATFRYWPQYVCP